MTHDGPIFGIIERTNCIWEHALIAAVAVIIMGGKECDWREVYSLLQFRGPDIEEGIALTAKLSMAALAGPQAVHTKGLIALRTKQHIDFRPEVTISFGGTMQPNESVAFLV